ncbi:MAG: ribosome small subunit-dependent GTPase A [Ruminococcaceae bacterium]|nr:ribosome small subunit-dependent GTPase A [Oscillospiraceae bacterium]
MIGRIISCVGGVYTVECENTYYRVYAKGTFRHEGIVPVAGDMVEFTNERVKEGREDVGIINRILERKNVLIRPEVANIDTMFIVFALSSPDPNLLAIDKLTAIAAHADISVVIVFNKEDLANEEEVKYYSEIYKKSGYKVVTLEAGNNKEEAREKLLPLAKGKVSVFTGPSGVGKSTIINALFPHLKLETGVVSEKTRRGKNTTRSTTLYKTGEDSYFVDTPGFTLLDFDRFKFMKKEELVHAFPEYSPLVANCRYTKCTHTKEEGCAILEKIKDGSLPPSRHESFLALWEILKNHKDWEKN